MTAISFTIDRELLSCAKRYARERGVSPSEVIEGRLRQLSSDSDAPSFSARWRGKFEPTAHEDARFDALARKYL